MHTPIYLYNYIHLYMCRAAERIIKEFPEFDVAATLSKPDGKIMLTTEHVHS